MNRINNKKAFTLTELLVVTILISSLVAVGLPKYHKILETEKTSEVDAIMHAVRIRQELRCSIGKPYVSLAKLGDLIPNTNTKHFVYYDGTDGKGLIAASKGMYTYYLKMLSYRDGRVCCEGEDCGKLNKSYPSCSSLRLHLVQAPECNPTPVAL